MKQNLKLVYLDTDYCNYLRKYDSKVVYNYDQKSTRPYVGVLFKMNKIMYFAPLSSPKLKHKSIRNNIDIIKIDKGNLGVINLNNMIPVSKNNIIEINLSQIVNLKYQKLLIEQIYWINRHKETILKKSYNLYQKYCNGTLNIYIKERCCNFILLNIKCEKYTKILINN